MKRTVQINLFGTVYTIDEDAHQLLEQYFSNMRSYFSRQAGGDEIADDIEHRVAELFWDIRESDNGWSAISIEQVRDIIQKVGNPEQMTDPQEGALPNKTDHPADGAHHTEDGKEQHTTTEGGTSARNDGRPHDNRPAGEQTQQPGSEGLGGWLQNRRFFRDPQDKRIGGVISGACHYFGAKDVTKWRLIYALACALAVFCDWPFFISFIESAILWTIPFYLLVWMIAPEAHTAEERLRMQGKPVNPDSINEELLHAHGVYGNANQPAPTQAQGCLGGFTDVIAVCAKALLIIIGIGMAIAFILPIVCLMALLCNLPILGFAPDLVQNANDEKGTLILLVIALIVLVALPIYALCRWLIKSDKHLSAGTTALLIVAWIIALAFTMFNGVSFFAKATDLSNWNWNYTYTVNTCNEGTTRVDKVEPFEAIELEGVGTVTFRQNHEDSYNVKCTGTERLIQETQIYVENGVLKVCNTTEQKQGEGLTIEVTSPMLRAAQIRGVGSLVLADTIQVSNPVELSMEGVGSMKADYLEATTISASNKGVGSSQLNVKCDSLNVVCEGIGAMKLSGETHYYQRNNTDLLGTIKDSGLDIKE